MLEGTRVVLRAVEATDAERLQRWVNGGESRAWLDGVPALVSRRSQERWLEAAGAGRDANYRVFAVETRDSRHVGMVQVRDIQWVHRRARMDLLVGEPELRETGFEADVIRTMIAFGADMLNLHRIETRLPANSPRVQSYLAAGFVMEGRARDASFVGGQYIDEVILGWLAQGESRIGVEAERPAVETAAYS